MKSTAAEEGSLRQGRRKAPARRCVWPIRWPSTPRCSSSGVAHVDPQRAMTVRHPFHGGGYEFAVPLLPGDHVTADTGTGFVHTAPGHGEDDFDLMLGNRDLFAARSRSLQPGAARTVRYATNVPLFAGKKHPHARRQGRRRQRRGDQGADRSRRAARQGHAAPPISAFLALQGAGHLPRHAAMVRRHRQAVHRLQRRDLARARASAPSRDTNWYPRAGENRIGAMVREPARLGAVAPARLGRAHRGLRRQEDAASCCATTPSTRASPMPSKPKARMPGSIRRRRVSWAKRKPTTTSRSPTFSTSGSIPAPPMPSWWKTRSIRRLAARRIAPIFISKAPTSIAAGSSPRCWNPAARAAARPMARC